jgi:hypothetical protein
MMENHVSASKQANMGDIKICSRCYSAKALTEFYRSRASLRSECKECTKISNSLYQKKCTKKRVYKNEESRKEYLREYYEKNKEKFTKYREQFKRTHPNYHHQYYLDHKGK